MADETAGSGVSVHVSELHGIATRLGDTSTTLHGHADTMASASIPLTAFGAADGAGASWEQVRAELEGTLRHHAQRVAGHGANARGVAVGQADTDAAGSTAVTDLKPAVQS